MSEAVRELIDELGQARDAFVASQKETASKLRDAAREERERLREQMAANREDWLARQTELREEIRNRVKELRENLPNHHEIVDQAREIAEGRRRGR